MRVTHERIEETAPPEVEGYEDDAVYRRDEFNFEFDGEVYSAHVLDREPRVAYVRKLTAGPDNDECLARIKKHLVEHAHVRTLRTIDWRKGYYAKWPRRRGFPWRR